MVNGGPINRPTVIAHRTSLLHAPENSLEGILTAARQGADAVEIDVRMTRDGTLILMHDATAWRTYRKPVLIRRSGSRRLLGFAPTFALAVDVLPPGLALAVDIKDPRAMPVVIDQLRAAGALHRALLWCRSVRAVAEAARSEPGSEIALLRNTSSSKQTRQYLTDARSAGAHAVSLHQRAVTAGVVDEAHELGLTAYAWVVEQGADAPVLDCGVDGVVTDWVADALAARD
ncbi:MAG: glycerophosphodiester phosphodiesterase, partial [Mycobacteriales bacterium]